MLIHIPALLGAEQVAALRSHLDGAAWSDGAVTAGFQSGRVKDNLQVGSDSAIGRELGLVVIRALETSPAFLSAALPRHVFPPLFNRYDAGMGFGTHIDNAVRQVPGTGQRMRTDLSATLFLSDPATYDGGELVIDDTYGAHRVKPAAGDMVLYPARSLHRVEPVTRGSRVAAFFWVQSMVKSGDHREMLHDLDQSIQALGAPSAHDDPAIIRLSALYHNLLREWGEV
ncbi:Fe2+-dependent dioxygenase [Novosphingobium sp.]|uniref:Fe2+-dependent dioxygenase n=1 Tax=Novosphingobium sp. TaxID=1874826 RepID=UPI003D0C5374